VIKSAASTPLSNRSTGWFHRRIDVEINAMKVLPIDDAVLLEVSDHLGRVPLFQPLSIEQRQEIAQISTLIEVRGGETIVTEGEASSDFYVMLTGEASVMIRLSDQGEQIEVSTLQPGETMGEMAAFLDEPRLATVIATRTSRLIRVDPDTLSLLYERIPSFGLAMSQELARRLKEALGIKNELQIEKRPDKVVMSRQDVSHMRSYMARYYATAVKNLLRRHRLLVERHFPDYEVEFRFSEREQASWFQAFDVTEKERSTPFTYYTTSVTMMLMHVVEDVGVNFRHLMHLKTEMTFHPGGRILEPETTYTVKGNLDDIVQLRDDRVALVTRTWIHDEDGELLQTNKDFFIILNIEPEYIEVLRSTSGFGRHNVSELAKLIMRRPKMTSGDVQRIPIEVPDDMGVQYGKVSGDMNMVHTTKFAARIFGFRKPFIQGLCTANYVLKHLTGADDAPVLNLTATFARRVYVGQTVYLHFNDREFEVCNEKGALLAFGAWEYDLCGFM